jgi:hypothetical protein
VQFELAPVVPVVPGPLLHLSAVVLDRFGLAASDETLLLQPLNSADAKGAVAPCLRESCEATQIGENLVGGASVLRERPDTDRNVIARVAFPRLPALVDTIVRFIQLEGSC